MNPELIGLGSLAGMALSLAMTYIPGLNVLYARQSETVKQSIMGALIIISGIANALYTGQGGDWRSIATAIVAALITNQPTDRISPEPSAVKEAKAETKAAEARETVPKTFVPKDGVW